MSRLPNWLYEALEEHGVRWEEYGRNSFAPREKRTHKYAFCGFYYQRVEGRRVIDALKGPFRTESAAMVDAALHYRLMHEDGTPTRNALPPKVVPLRKRAA
jgi:hypothetical protein